MTRLATLLDAFVMVIVQYHTEKMSASAEKESQLILELKTLSREDMKIKLEALIEEATNKDGSKKRLSLMTYLLSNIDALRLCLDYPGMMPEEDFSAIKKQWVELIVNIQALLKKSQYETATTMQIPGLVRGALKGYSFCTAGTLLQKALIKFFDGSTEASIEKITHTITDYFNDHELEMSKQALKDEQIKVQQLAQEVSRLKQVSVPVAPSESLGSIPQKPGMPIGYALVYPCIKTQPAQKGDTITYRSGTPGNFSSIPRIGSSQSIFNPTFWSNLIERRPSISQATVNGDDDDIEGQDYVSQA